ncbi:MULTISPECIES: YgjV family protein [unclassified Thioalkalivibrio]|uniref:YgjV family protein n=1 Tax=unclassified Thioalkalivibrio TaxID=2621013 RepID=UPI0003645B70|nr:MULTISPECIES: YgjV family protein [unclassified Thioalkalivibrio]
MDLTMLLVVLSGIAASATQFGFLFGARWRPTLFRGLSGAMALWSLHFYLLGTPEVSVLLVVASAYMLLVASKPSWMWAGIAISIYLAVSALSMSVAGWVVGAGSIVFVVGGLLHNTLHVRALFLVGHGLFFANALLVGSIVAMINEGLMSAANLRAMWRDHIDSAENRNPLPDTDSARSTP